VRRSKRIRSVGRFVAVAAFGAVAAFSSQVLEAVSLFHEVSAADNLYHTNWGHPYSGTPAADPPLAAELLALGTGQPARSVRSGDVPYDFSVHAFVTTIATGLVVDDGPIATGPDGYAGAFRGLPVYSLIGLWSATPSAIASIGDPFFIGEQSTLLVPRGASAYLFLGENDGYFPDNSGTYLVALYAFGIAAASEPGIAAVPEPSTRAIILAGLGLLGFMARRRGCEPPSCGLEGSLPEASMYARERKRLQTAGTCDREAAQWRVIMLSPRGRAPTYSQGRRSRNESCRYDDWCSRKLHDLGRRPAGERWPVSLYSARL
jgi:hypothetical protein